MKALIKTYYKLTGKIPRRLPQTPEEFDRIKKILIETYNLEDSPQVWYTVASHMASTHPAEIKRSYEALANIAKRMKINGILQDQKLLAEKALKDKMEELAKKAAEEAQKLEAPQEVSNNEDVQAGTHDPQ
jgi:hypothetical protein